MITAHSDDASITLPYARGHHRDRFPPRGILFLIACITGPALIAAGWWFGVSLLLYAGITIILLIALLILLGDLF